MLHSRMASVQGSAGWSPQAPLLRRGCARTRMAPVRAHASASTSPELRRPANTVLCAVSAAALLLASPGTGGMKISTHTHAQTHTHTQYTHIHIRTHARMHAHTHIRMHTRVYTHTHVRTHKQAHTLPHIHDRTFYD